MSGEFTNLIAILGVGIALATLMFAMFRIQDRKTLINDLTSMSPSINDLMQSINVLDREVDRRFDEVNRRFEILEARVDRLVEDVAESQGIACHPARRSKDQRSRAA